MLVGPNLLPPGRHTEKCGSVGDDVVERIQRSRPFFQAIRPPERLHRKPFGAGHPFERFPISRCFLIFVAEPPVAFHHLGAVGLVFGDRARIEFGCGIVVRDLRVVPQGLARPTPGGESAPEAVAEPRDAQDDEYSPNDL